MAYVQSAGNAAPVKTISKAAKAYAVRASLIAALGGFLFGFETAVISGAEKTIQQLWSLSSGWLGFTVASSLIGTVIGSIVAGTPAQRFGRKKKHLPVLPLCTCFQQLDAPLLQSGSCLFCSVLLAALR